MKRAVCPECGDRLFAVYYIAPRTAKNHVAKTNFLVCRGCPRFFALSIIELPLQILPAGRKRTEVSGSRSRGEFEGIGKAGVVRDQRPREAKARIPINPVLMRD